MSGEARSTTTAEPASLRTQPEGSLLECRKLVKRLGNGGRLRNRAVRS